MNSDLSKTDDIQSINSNLQNNNLSSNISEENLSVLNEQSEHNQINELYFYNKNFVKIIFLVIIITIVATILLFLDFSLDSLSEQYLNHIESRLNILKAGNKIPINPIVMAEFDDTNFRILKSFGQLSDDNQYLKFNNITIPEENLFFMNTSEKINDTANDTNYTTIKENTNYDFKYNLVYEFVKNITYFSYKGRWTNLKVKDNIFENEMGTSEIDILRNFTYPLRFNIISNMESVDALYFIITLRDGDYRDKHLNLNMNISFNENFSYYLYEILNKVDDSQSDSLGIVLNKKISFSLNNITLNYIQTEILGSNKNASRCHNANVDFEFIHSKRIYRDNFENQIVTEFPQVFIKIKDDECAFSVNLEMEINDDGSIEKRIWNYSIIITFISIIEIYLTLELLKDVSENNQVGKNICLITVGMNIMWNSFLCIIHFYLSITNESYSYDYGTPSMTFFLLFSIFELRLLFFVWRARYYELMNTDMSLFRKKLMRFYSTFYIVLFLGLLFMTYIFSSFITCYIFFACTWIFQIIHSAINGTKPPFNLKYIFMLSLGKLYAPLYIKACPYNLFELKPAYWKIAIITVTVLIEIGIMILQKVVGPKFFVPSCMKTKPYNYYIDLENEENSNTYENIECIICLECLFKPLRDNANFEQENTENRYAFSLKNKVLSKFKLWVEYLKYNHNKTKHMITPCKHIFHSDCLEKWMDLKNECPYCRCNIPPLE